MADFSINAGLDDDDERELADLESRTPTLQNDVIVNTTEVRDLPRVDYETKQIAAANDALESLLFVVEDIVKATGMSQTIATEALKYMPDFDGNRPLGYYSRSPTATRLNASLESISSGVWALIAAGIAAAGIMIYKILRWLMGLKSSSSATGNTSALTKEITKKAKEDEKNATVVEKGLNKLSDQCDRIDTAISEGVDVKAPEGHVYSPNNMEMLTRMVLDGDPGNNDSSEFLEGRNPFFFDVVTGGPYTAMVSSILPAVESIQQILAVKIDIIKTIISDSADGTSDSVPMVASNQLRDLVLPLSLNVAGKESTLANLSTALANQRENTGLTKPNSPLPLISVIKSTAAIFESGHNVQRIIELTNLTADTLGNMDELLVSLKAAVAAAGNVHSEVAPDALIRNGTNLRLAIETIQHDILDLATLLKQFEHYRLVCINLGERVVLFVEQTAMKIQVAIADTALPSVQKEFATLARIARETRSSQIEHFKRIFPDAI